MIKTTATIVSQEAIAPDIYSLWLKTAIAKEAKPGQFVSLFTGDAGKLLPRPLSLCEIASSEDMLRIVYKVTGEKTGTALFSRMEIGETIEIMGPLGHGFPIVQIDSIDGKQPLETVGVCKNQETKILLIGGGIGIPPMLQLAKEYAHLYGKEAVLCVMGYRDALFLHKDFERHGSLFVASEDGKSGVKGNVLDAMHHHAIKADVVFACGPNPMLKAVKNWAEHRDIPCYLSLEEKMACGIGACLACVCATKDIHAKSNLKQARVCKDGPVFLSTEVEL